MPGTSSSGLAGSSSRSRPYTLVIYVIRTRRIPFFKSRPSLPMLLVPTGAALVGAILPYTGLAHLLVFTPLPATFFLLLFGMGRLPAPGRTGQDSLLPQPALNVETPRRATTRLERLERQIHRRVSRFMHPLNHGQQAGVTGGAVCGTRAKTKCIPDDKVSTIRTPWQSDLAIERASPRRLRHTRRTGGPTQEHWGGGARRAGQIRWASGAGGAGSSPAGALFAGGVLFTSDPEAGGHVLCPRITDDRPND